MVGTGQRLRIGRDVAGSFLFVVLRAAVHGGAMTGVITGLTHALGVGIMQ